MNYVMSDLHGEYELYMQMLEKIDFSEDDMLYVVGDVLDRGKHPVSILLDMMKRPNVVLLAGNHEQMAADCLGFCMQEITEKSVLELKEKQIGKLMNWYSNGAKTTMDEFFRLDAETRQEVLEYIEEADLYEEVEVGDKTYILVHGGLGNFSPDRDLWEYDAEELLWTRPDYEVPYFDDDRYVITGHTPTAMIEGNPDPGYIFRKNHHIAIDCGCSFDDGRLGCIRLEDEAEFYVGE